MIDITYLKKLSYDDLEAIKSQIETLLIERKKEKEDKEKILSLIKELGYNKLEDLGLTQLKITTQPNEEKTKKTNEAPTKPKLRIISKENTFYYQDKNQDNKWCLITVPTVKIKLEKDGIKITSYNEMDEELSNTIETLYNEYENSIINAYNEKAKIWNEFAIEKGLEEVPYHELKRPLLIEEN